MIHSHFFSYRTPNLLLFQSFSASAFALKKNFTKQLLFTEPSPNGLQSTGFLHPLFKGLIELQWQLLVIRLKEKVKKKEIEKDSNYFFFVGIRCKIPVTNDNIPVINETIVNNQPIIK